MIGKNIRNLRNEKKLSLRALAELAGISKSTLSDTENGNNNTSVNTLQKIADALHVSLSDILVSPENSYSIELLTTIQSAYHEKDNYSTGNIQLLNFLSRELNIDSAELFEKFRH